MAWLTSLLKKPESDENVALLEPELTPEEPAVVLTTGPQLAVLVPDNAGISSFRLRTLPDAGSASEHVAALAPQIRNETHAFWALHDKPIVDESAHVEALVLIRAQAESDLVYVVSFLDIESALSFTRFEVRRGLHLGNVMIYWAAFAQIREELDGISIHPAFAPPTVDYHLPAIAHKQAHAPETVASVAVAEPEVEIEPEPIVEPAPETVVETKARQSVEEYLRKRSDQRQTARIEPVVERAAPVEEPAAMKEAAPAVEPVVIEAAPIAEPVIEPAITEVASIVAPDTAEDDDDLGPLWPEANVGAAALAGEPEISSPVAAEQAAIDEAFVLQHRSVQFRPHVRPSALETMGEADGLLVDHEELQIATFGTDSNVAERLAGRLGIGEPEPSIETIPGDEELDTTQFVPLGSADPTLGLAQTPKLDDFDIAYEVERLLRHRKWEAHDGPFSGFRSPPGRF